MFQAVYESAWHHPVVCFAGVVALLSLVARRLPFLTAYLILFALEIAADALVTGAWTPTTPATKQPLAIAFVILGDFRYLLLFERYTRLTPGQGGLGPPKSGRFWLTASALAFVVPLTQTALLKTMPAVFADPVWIFLVYELLFAALTTILLLVVLPRRMPAPSPERRFVRAISIFFL
ncbi:MAG: hypothetical protein KC636_31680, partial [Myxococcales bacterium]|nr:hypothetical protein [Myxococcales bacterium]